MLKEQQEKYFKDYGRWQISKDKVDGNTVSYTKYYIDTSRFRAETIFTEKDTFEELPETYKTLYKGTFGNEEVVKYYSTGKVQTAEEFVGRIKMYSLRARYNYPFTGFIAFDKETDEVVGVGVIGNGSKESTGETAGFLTLKYQNKEDVKGVGFECAGALIWGYGGEELYSNKFYVNQRYNLQDKEFGGGSVFHTVECTAHPDNSASLKLIEKLGFTKIDTVKKFGGERHCFKLSYNSIREEPGTNLNTIYIDKVKDTESLSK